jgi:hypothetical protein
LSDQRVFAVQTLDEESDTADDEHEADDGFHTNLYWFGERGEFTSPREVSESG